MNENEKQRILDEEHLKLLRIGYIVAGAADAFFALFPLIYVVMGIFIAAAAPGGGRPGEPNPALFGVIFVILGLVISLLSAGSAALKFAAARALGKKQSRMLCMIAAGLSCIGMPWGTLLGVFTFLVLGRSSVKAMFDGPAGLLSEPSARVATSLFSQDEAVR